MKAHSHIWLEEMIVGTRTCCECGLVVQVDHRETSIGDWATKAARQIDDEYSITHGQSVERIAVIIAMFAEPLMAKQEHEYKARRIIEEAYAAVRRENDALKALLREAKREHLPQCKSVASVAATTLGMEIICNCGADAWNARIDKLLK